MATVDFSGTYKLDRSDENFEQLMQVMGMNIVFRKIMNTVKPTMTIKQDGDKFEISTKLPMFTQSQAFTVGEEFEIEFPWDKKMHKFIASWEGEKLITKPTVEMDQPVQIRELRGGEFVITSKKDDLVTSRYFKRVQDK